MTATEHTSLPSDAELIVPQEITLSSPWLKAIGIYMGMQCEKEINEFMLLRREYGNDPRKVLKEGKQVTACGVNFIRQLRKVCLNELSEYAYCLDNAKGGEMLPHQCRPKQYPLDVCVEDNFQIRRPQLGHFSKIHVHDSPIRPPPLRYNRDYKAEAAKAMDELPKDFHISTERFKRHRPYVMSLGSEGTA